MKQLLPMFNINYRDKLFDYLCRVSVIFAACTVSTLCVFASSGFDLTDEGYYLSSIENYSIFSVSSTQFGFIYHIIYDLSFRDVATLRIIILTTGFVVSFWLSLEILRDSQRLRLPLSIGVAATSATVANGWLLTPSYNSLAVQSALLCMVGLSLVLRKDRNDLGAFLIGLAGCFSFMAKPTTAAALAILVFVALVITKKLSFRLIFVAGLVTLTGFLIIAVAIDGDIVSFLHRLQLSFEDRGALQGYYLLKGDDSPNVWSMPNWRRVMALSFVVIFAVWGKYAEIKSSLLIVGLFGVAVGAAIIVGFGYPWPALLQSDEFWRLAPFAIAVGLIAGLVIFQWRELAYAAWHKDYAIIAVLLLLPFATALGSNVNYWIVGSSASIAWTLAGLRLASMLGQRRVIAVGALSAQLIVVVTILMWIGNPYRQDESVLAQNTPTKIGSGTLYVSKVRANYLVALQNAAVRSGFKQGMPILDLTGHSPGVLFALGARPVAEPWLLGGYPGSNAFTKTAIRRTPCQTVANAWLLIERGGPRAISPDAIDINISRFIPVARVTTPPSDYPGGSTQLLLRPGGDEQSRIAACEATR